MRQLAFFGEHEHGLAWHASSISVPLCPLLWLSAICIPILRLAATSNSIKFGSSSHDWALQ